MNHRMVVMGSWGQIHSTGVTRACNFGSGGGFGQGQKDKFRGRIFQPQRRCLEKLVIGQERAKKAGYVREDAESILYKLLMASVPQHNVARMCLYLNISSDLSGEGGD
ncbi:uncharacterized protein LOC125217924 [Salvia hispanica]|uniref:uncharacterized protein LOC125217924 n=1 Tax=Salvia hispanica TaxID=49212 RepID=UPI002009D808|nr:uncharacterized protein LOC125217924 [Salvia hispanica]